MTKYKKILVSVAASAVMVGSLNASSINLTLDTALPAEINGTVVDRSGATLTDAIFAQADTNITVVDATADTLDAGVLAVVYTPTVNIGVNSKVTLKVNNGSIIGNSALYFKSTNSGDASTQLNIVAGESTPNAAGDGFSTLVFIAPAEVVGGQDLVLSNSNAEIVAPVIVGNKGLQADQNVTIAITKVVYSDGTTPNTNAVPAAATNVVGIEKAFTATVGDAATSIISVEADRKEFNTEGFDNVFGTDKDTNTTGSINDKITMTDAGGLIDQGLTMTVKTDGNCDAVTGVKLMSAGGDIVASTEGNSSSCLWKFTDAAVLTQLKLATGVRVAIDTNDSAVHEASTWTTSLDINSSVAGEQTLFADKTTHVWTLDGSQFIVPYFHTDIVSYGTYVVLTNTTAKAAGVTIDVFADKAVYSGVQQTTQVCTSVPLTNVPANSTRLYLPSEINDAIEAECAGFKAENQRYMGKFTVETPIGKVIPTAFQKDPALHGGKRAVPVYKPTDVGAGKTGWRE